MNFIPFHSSICKGRKRSLSRATRFIYLELCLLTRDSNGVYDLPDEPVIDAIHDVLGGDKSEIGEAIPALIEADMLMVEDGILTIVNYEEWQLASSDAERARRYRARERARKLATVTDASHMPSRPDRVEENRIEREIVPPSPAPSKKRRVACPEATAPEAKEFAKTWQLPLSDPEVGKFLDFHNSKGNLMVNWTAAWRTWQKNQIAYKPFRGGQQTSLVSDAVLLQDAAESEREVAKNRQQGPPEPRVSAEAIAKLRDGIGKGNRVG